MVVMTMVLINFVPLAMLHVGHAQEEQPTNVKIVKEEPHEKRLELYVPAVMVMVRRVLYRVHVIF